MTYIDSGGGLHDTVARSKLLDETGGIQRPRCPET